MSIFGTTYNDEQLVMEAERALAEDPAVDTAQIEIVSDKGIVTLSGRVSNDLNKRRAIDAVRRWYERNGLKYERIEDQIQLS